MNSSGVFSIDAPIGLFYAYFFHGGVFLTLGGLAHSVSMLFRQSLRRAAYVALGLVILPLVYFYVVTAIASKTEGNPPDPVYLLVLYGIVAAAGASLLYGVVARQRLTETSAATETRRSRG